MSPAFSSTSSPPIRVLLVDDHSLVREGLRALLERRGGLAICGETDNAPEAVSLAVRHRPQLAIVDVALRSTNGLELTKALLARDPRLLVLVISMLDPAVYAERALRAGAKGFLMKNAGSAAFLEAVQCILAGGVYRGALPAAEAAAPLPELSDREVEVLALLGDGCTTRRIAEQLNLSVKTIDTYRENLKRKLGLPNAEALIHYAIQWVRNPGHVPASIE